jgi:hypothetical protein
MLVLSSTTAWHCYNCCRDSGTSLGNNEWMWSILTSIHNLLTLNVTDIIS